MRRNVLYRIKVKFVFLLFIVIMNPIILKTLVKNHNVITTSQVLALGFSKQILTEYVKLGLLARVRQGVYMLKDSLHDDMFTLSLLSDNIVFSHESAFFLNGLSNRTPFIHSITIPSNKTISSVIKRECKCFYIKPDLYEISITQKKTTFGNRVKCYDLERTICDFLRSRGRCDEDIVVHAIKNYVSYSKKNLNKLNSYAELLKVSKELRKYLEVLL